MHDAFKTFLAIISVIFLLVIFVVIIAFVVSLF
jgi:hypothetical protein